MSTGNYLLKCSNFTFSSQTCFEGEYEQIATDLIPGQNYTITFNSTDPGFGITIKGPENVSDSYIVENMPDSNFGGSPQIRVGDKGAGKITRGVILFNLSDIPAGVKIISANLSLNFFNALGPNPDANRTHLIHRVQQTPARNWTELGVTWNSYDGNNWTTAGGDFNATATDSQTFDVSSLNTFIIFNVTSDVQSFVDNQSLNFGWIIKDQNESAGLKGRADYASNENPNESIRTKLEVSFVTEAEGPTFVSTTIDPYAVLVNESVLLNATATDDVGVDSITANITLPNGTVVKVDVPTNYNVTAEGRHNVTFIANDTS